MGFVEDGAYFLRSIGTCHGASLRLFDFDPLPAVFALNFFHRYRQHAVAQLGFDGVGLAICEVYASAHGTRAALTMDIISGFFVHVFLPVNRDGKAVKM